MQPSRKQQPNRLDRFRLNATTAFHTSTDSTFYQNYYPRLWKAEYNSVLSDKLFFETRTGMFGYNWPDHNHTDAPSFEDIGNNEVFGAARNRDSRPRRYQVLGSLSYFKDNFAGSHNLKFGWEIFRETSTIEDLPGSYNNVLHILRNTAPIEVTLFENPTKSENGLWAYGVYLNDSWKVSDRWSLNLGVRFDRYRNFLPEQEHPVGRFNPVAQTFAEIENTNTFNTLGPRFGMTYNLSGDGRTVAKFNIGRYWWNPGTRVVLQPEPERVVEAVRLDRPESEWCLGSWRRRSPARDGRRRRNLDARPGPERFCTPTRLRPGSSASSCPTSACGPELSGGVCGSGTTR